MDTLWQVLLIGLFWGKWFSLSLSNVTVGHCIGEASIQMLNITAVVAHMAALCGKQTRCSLNKLNSRQLCSWFDFYSLFSSRS